MVATEAVIVYSMEVYVRIMGVIEWSMEKHKLGLLQYHLGLAKFPNRCSQSSCNSQMELPVLVI